jgi:hypothetical protein
MESENKEIIFINDVVSQVLFLSARLWLITSLDWKTITICAFVMLLLQANEHTLNTTRKGKERKE